jgi:RHS repeat-associated protein
VVQLTDESGAVTKDYHYDAFGVEIGKDESDTNPWRYCGEYFDKETNNIYLRTRYYNPYTGRFGTEDLIRNGLNWYTYCAGNPAAFIDPFGLAERKTDDSAENDRLAALSQKRYNWGMEIIDKWLDGGKVSDAQLWLAIKWLAKYGGQTSVGKFEGKHSLNRQGHEESFVMTNKYDKYDMEILGFTNYWNTKMGLTGDNCIGANLIKAIIMKESAMGTLESVDVMKSLGDAGFPILSKGTIQGSDYPIQAGEGYWIFANISLPNGECNMLNANPIISIAGGIRILLFDNLSVARYNGNGDEKYLQPGDLSYAGMVNAWLNKLNKN